MEAGSRAGRTAGLPGSCCRAARWSFGLRPCFPGCPGPLRRPSCLHLLGGRAPAWLLCLSPEWEGHLAAAAAAATTGPSPAKSGVTEAATLPSLIVEPGNGASGDCPAHPGLCYPPVRSEGGTGLEGGGLFPWQGLLTCQKEELCWCWPFSERGWNGSKPGSWPWGQAAPEHGRRAEVLRGGRDWITHYQLGGWDLSCACPVGAGGGWP